MGIEKMLWDEPPYLVHKGLAVIVGVDGALFLQQIHFLTTKYGKEIEGRRWFTCRLAKLHEKFFPFWPERTIRRIVDRLEEEGWLTVEQDAGATPRYGINYEKVESKYSLAKVATPPAKVATGGGQNGQREGGQNGHRVADIRDKQKIEILRDQTSGTEVPLVQQPKALSKSVAKEQAEKTSKEVQLAFLKKPTVPKLITFWKDLLSLWGHRAMNLSFSKREHGMMKSLIHQLSNGDADGKRVSQFLEFAVKHWHDLRKKIVWPNNPKKSRLDEVPTFEQVFYNREDILHWMDNKGVITGEAARTVFTSVSQIPKTHPHYAKLKALVERTGKATLSH